MPSAGQAKDAFGEDRTVPGVPGLIEARRAAVRALVRGDVGAGPLLEGRIVMSRVPRTLLKNGSSRRPRNARSEPPSLEAPAGSPIFPDTVCLVVKQLKSLPDVMHEMVADAFRPPSVRALSTWNV